MKKRALTAILGLALTLPGCISQESTINNETTINKEASDILSNMEQIRKYYNLTIYDTITIIRPRKYGDEFSIMFYTNNRKQVYTYKDKNKNGKYDEVKRDSDNKMPDIFIFPPKPREKPKQQEKGTYI